MLSFLTDDKKIIDDGMEAALVSFCGAQDEIVEAMRYSALGGKRIRGILTIEFAKMLGCITEDVLPYALGIECVQAYSLVHDDLPCMDNDDMRRGKPSCHIAFGESTAVLAGDALLTHAFSVIAESKAAESHPERAVKAIAKLADYAGYRGMVGGQVLDLSAAEKEVSADELATIHALKTAALVKASAAMGCIAAGADEEICALAEKYAELFGLAFQMADDLLDFNGNYDECELNSYVKIHGAERTRSDIYSCISKAGTVLFKFNEKGFDTGALAALLDFLITRVEGV